MPGAGALFAPPLHATECSMHRDQGRNDGGAKGAQFPGRRITMGAPNQCGERRKVLKTSQVLSSTAHLLPKDFRLEHGSNMGG